MFQPQTIELVYVGNKKYKTDNVCGTGTVWIGYGDAQTIERKHVPKFLKHPDVWMTKVEFEKLNSENTQEGLQLNVNAFLGGDGGTDPIKLCAPDSSESTVPAANIGTVGLGDAGISLANASTNAPVGSATNIDTEPGAGSESPCDPAGESGDALIAAKNAILALEQGNHAHFSSTTGVPIVSAVRNAAGDETITAAHVRAAWAELNPKGA